MPKTVLLAGLCPEDLGRCQGIIIASFFVANDEKNTLSGIQRNPEVAVINIDHFRGEDFLKQVEETGFAGKVILATNNRKLFRTQGRKKFISFRDVPEAVSRALTR